MKWIALAFALAACQHGEAGSPPPADQPAVTDAYRADIAALCDVVHRSGADQVSDPERPQVTAMWLSQNITTEDAHKFLARIQPLEGEPKARALDDEAHRVGLPGCALADEWRRPH